MQLELLDILPSLKAGVETSVCKKCNQEKPITEYRLYRRATGDKDSRDSKCKQCSKDQQDVADRLRRTAPAYKGTCACCGKDEDNPVLDHCHDTEIFRGWLCPPCNLGSGTLGDRLEDIENALLYLRKAYGQY